MAEKTARDIMTPDPATVSPGATVTEAARLMIERGVGALPVVDEGRFLGLVTEGDLIVKDIKLEYPTYIHLLDGFIMYPPSTTKFEHELKKAVAATVEDVMTAEAGSTSTRPGRSVAFGRRPFARASSAAVTPFSRASAGSVSPRPTVTVSPLGMMRTCPTRSVAHRMTFRSRRPNNTP